MNRYGQEGMRDTGVHTCKKRFALALESTLLQLRAVTPTVGDDLAQYRYIDDAGMGRPNHRCGSVAPLILPFT